MSNKIKKKKRNNRKKSSNSSNIYNLPIYSKLNEIKDAFEKSKVLIIIAETGAGKSTQIPRILYNTGIVDRNKSVVCTQPRRIAAISLAKRVADEVNGKLGSFVGYKVY